MSTDVAAPLDHAGIAARIPHAGRMCLLERALAWDEQRLVAIASNHRDHDHPLRTASGLLATCAIEYAAQAMALHGALLGHASGAASRPGALASARGVRLARRRLDDLPGELRIEVERHAGDARQILYAFTIDHANERIAEGRATVVLDPAFERP